MAESRHRSISEVIWYDPGWRGLVGFISPPGPAFEPMDFIRIAPEGFRVVQTLTYVPGFVAKTEKIAEAARQLENCCLSLKQAGVDIIAQSGTPFSFVNGGLDFARNLHLGLEKLTGIPVVMMGLAVVNALQKKGYRSVAVACTYYTDDLAARYTKFLEAAGIKVLAMENWLSQNILGSQEEVDFWRRRAPIGMVYKSARIVGNHCSEADCFIISGGGVRTMDILQPLEEDLGKPVISSSAAQFWEIFTRLGVSPVIQGRGSLLAGGGGGL